MSNIKNMPNVNAASSMIFDMEPALHDAANLATALAMALGGVGTRGIEPRHEELALECLANVAQLAAHKSLAMWSEAHDLAKAADALASM